MVLWLWLKSTSTFYFVIKFLLRNLKAENAKYIDECLASSLITICYQFLMLKYWNQRTDNMFTIQIVSRIQQKKKKKHFATLWHDGLVMTWNSIRFICMLKGKLATDKIYPENISKSIELTNRTYTTRSQAKSSPSEVGIFPPYFSFRYLVYRFGSIRFFI